MMTETSGVALVGRRIASGDGVGDLAAPERGTAGQRACLRGLPVLVAGSASHQPSGAVNTALFNFQRPWLRNGTRR